MSDDNRWRQIKLLMAEEARRDLHEVHRSVTEARDGLRRAKAALEAHVAKATEQRGAAPTRASTLQQGSGR